MREPPKGQVQRQKYSALSASVGFTIRPCHPSGEEEGSFYISGYPSAPVSELEECLLTTSSLYPTAIHSHTCTQTFYFHLGHGLQRDSVHKPRGTCATRPVSSEY